MATLGRCLAFQLKYPAEMKRLCWAKESDEKLLEGLPDPDGVLKRIQAVGHMVRREAADSLEACADRLEPHIEIVGGFKRRKSNLGNNWSLTYDYLPARKRLEVGVFISDSIPAIVPWIWSRGGRHAEDEIASRLSLPSELKASSGKVFMSTGAVALARIDVPIPDGPQAFDVDRDPLLAQVIKAFQVLSTANVAAIAAMSSGLTGE